MQIEIDYGSGGRTVLHIQAGRKGSWPRAVALQSALKELGRDASIGFCLHTVRTGEPVTLEDIPRVNTGEADRG